MIEKVGNLLIVTLVRKENYQKQLCIIPPNTKIPSHKHHNVRTNIVFLYGWVMFKKSEREIELTSPQDCERRFMINEGEAHAAETKEQHCIFISEQYWLDNENVRSLHLQWEGEPINKDHEEQLARR